MSTIEQMILDAKRLANRLKEKETMLDHLTNETERVHINLESMQKFQEDLNVLNKLARERSNNDMITAIHQENPQIREIQQENRQLKASIEEYQRAIELIMTKYRQHTQKQIEETRLDFERIAKSHDNRNCTSLISAQSEQLQEALNVMQEAIRIGDEGSNQYIEQLHQLKTENQTLRELLKIGRSMSSILIDNEMNEVGTQTEEYNMLVASALQNVKICEQISDKTNKF